MSLLHILQKVFFKCEGRVFNMEVKKSYFEHENLRAWLNREKDHVKWNKIEGTNEFGMTWNPEQPDSLEEANLEVEKVYNWLISIFEGSSFIEKEHGVWATVVAFDFTTQENLLFFERECLNKDGFVVEESPACTESDILGFFSEICQDSEGLDQILESWLE